ncbi:MAG: hypothetical protein Q3966_06410 [Neisseria sp.]|nr:hypothetical protein [Neisseria sp.]
MHRYTAAKWLNAARLLAFLACTLILLLLVASGIYTPTPKGRDGGWREVWDWAGYCALSFAGLWLYFQAPVLLLRRMGWTDRKIYRRRQIAALALEKSSGGWLCALPYFALFTGLSLGLLALNILSARLFPGNAWHQIMQDEFYRALSFAALPAIACQTLMGHITLNRIEKKRRQRKKGLSQGSRP